MKYIVKVANRSYEVEIQDIHSRPILARVNDQVFEVYPENEIIQPSQPEKKNVERKPLAPPQQTVSQSTSVTEVTAPLPGTVIELFIKAGEQIEAGQVILVIEAMKMKNSIRSTRAGRIAEVLISAGQTVAHKQALARFE